MTARKTEHCIDWSKPAAEIEAEFAAMAVEIEALKRPGLISKRFAAAVPIAASRELEEAYRETLDLRDAIGASGPFSHAELIEYAKEMRRDAARYAWLRAQVRGHRALGSARPASFAFPSSIDLPPLADIMKGSVAQHLDAAIDAARKVAT